MRALVRGVLALQAAHSQRKTNSWLAVLLTQVEGQTEDELVFLLAHDKDAFCRWEAGQRILRGLLTSLYTAASASKVTIAIGLP